MALITQKETWVLPEGSREPVKRSGKTRAGQRERLGRGDSVGTTTSRTAERGRQRPQERGGHSGGLLLRRPARPSRHLTHRAPRGNAVSPNDSDAILSGLTEATRATKGGTEVIKSGQAKKPGFLGLHAEHHARKGAGGGEEREAGREGAARGERPRGRGTRRRGPFALGRQGPG